MLTTTSVEVKEREICFIYTLLSRHNHTLECVCFEFKRYLETGKRVNFFCCYIIDMFFCSCILLH